MRFWYEWYEVAPSRTADGLTDLYRPEIPLRVIGKTGEAFLLGLLDTGADEVLLGRSVADAIGADLDHSARWSIRGFAGQRADAVLGRVEVEVSDGIETHRWPLAVGFVEYDDPALEQVAILGHTGFLQYFNAEFRGADREVVLTANDALRSRQPRRAAA